MGKTSKRRVGAKYHQRQPQPQRGGGGSRVVAAADDDDSDDSSTDDMPVLLARPDGGSSSSESNFRRSRRNSSSSSSSSSDMSDDPDPSQLPSLPPTTNYGGDSSGDDVPPLLKNEGARSNRDNHASSSSDSDDGKLPPKTTAGATTLAHARATREIGNRQFKKETSKESNQSANNNCVSPTDDGEEMSSDDSMPGLCARVDTEEMESSAGESEDGGGGRSRQRQQQLQSQGSSPQPQASTGRTGASASTESSKRRRPNKKRKKKKKNKQQQEEEKSLNFSQQLPNASMESVKQYERMKIETMLREEHPFMDNEMSDSSDSSDSNNGRQQGKLTKEEEPSRHTPSQPSVDPAKILLVEDACKWLSTQPFRNQKDSDKKKVQAPSRFKELLENPSQKTVSLIALVSALFPSNSSTWNEKEPLWVLLKQETSQELLARMLDCSSPIPTFAQDHVKAQAIDILKLVCKKARKKDVAALFNSGAVLPVPATLLPEMLDRSLSNDFRNTLGNFLTKIQLNSSAEEEHVKLVLKGDFGLGKRARATIDTALKDARSCLREEMRKKAESTERTIAEPSDVMGMAEDVVESSPDNVDDQKKRDGWTESPTQIDEFSSFQKQIDTSFEWYINEMNKQLLSDKSAEEEEFDDDHNNNLERQDRSDEDVTKGHNETSAHKFHPKDVTKELDALNDACASLTEAEAEDKLDGIETSLDLSSWNETSTWIVELTEQAHKFFRKHLKKEKKLCEKVLKRLQLLATGRWPYVLCKPVRTSGTSGANLKETKIDKARRILWEVSISFSPRRSTVNNPIAEQVIKVWDICDDHDNLSRDIDLAVNRIEKSYSRGQQCIMYSSIEGVGMAGVGEEEKSADGTWVPRTFTMKQEFISENTGFPSPPSSSQYFAPANHDENQFNLLKFYEVNAAAVQILLDSKTSDIDLPFVPGPRENEIIQKDTNRSLLLMGRSGTGKTTCMVFRIWSQYQKYYEDMQVAPRQLFVTKNTVLRNEVERSFRNMSMAYSKVQSSEIGGDSADAIKDSDPVFPIFMTSAEWLDALDRRLPGEHFFSQAEVEARGRGRSKDGDNVVQRGMEELEDETEDFNPYRKEKSTIRREMDFTMFQSLWPKINSKEKTKLNESLVWLEIISHIKGSMASLKIGQNPDDRQPFLSRDEYLALPKKQSRLDGASRSVVYKLYQRYEKIKKQENCFDLMDLVHAVASRIPAFQESKTYQDKSSFLPVDSVFVDEVQDFTQAELFILAKLCSSQNTLFLAGDTAQTIAVGVGFRFEDARQVLYETFSGNKPDVEKLSENYRSHKGVLQLAASVVELLYYFFPESLDRMPPDFGLFPGPQPILLKAQNMDDLVLRMVGAKRETSRIEFGAHQVVIVRNEEAKKNIPDGVGIDKEFVMTVAESKGLEFDDVLLLDFFSTSPAKDFWRIVSNYKQEAVAEYFASCAGDSYHSTPAVNKSFYWDEISPSDETRPLEFNADEHKILEGELKQLYTAITRSRVKVFIAETQEESCGDAIYNYFKRRRLIKQSSSSDEIELMGKTNTSEEWCDRGLYYYRMATADELNRAALKLAIKCFENGGDEKLASKSKAYLDFAEFDEDVRQNRSRRWRSSSDFKRRSYTVAQMLMETQEMELLGRAALCLARIGKQESSRAAKLFECHGIWYYRKFGHYFSKPPETATTSFSYGGRLYKKAGKYVDAFRCLLASGGSQEIREANDLLRDHHDLFSSPAEFKNVVATWNGQRNEAIKYWREKGSSKKVASVGLTMTDVAEVAARSFYSKNDEEGLAIAISAVPSTSQRIRICHDLDADSHHAVQKLPWASSIDVLQDNKSKRSITKEGENAIDMGNLILTKLGGGEEASRFLESRGRLMEASELLSTSDLLSDHKSRIFRLKLLYLELMLFETPEKIRSGYLSSLQELSTSLSKASKEIEDLGIDEHAILGLCRLRIKPNDPREAINAYKLCQESGNVLFLSEAISLILQQRNAMETLKSKEISGSDDVWEHFTIIEHTAVQLQQLARDLRSNSDSLSQLQAHSYYHLKPIPHYADLLEISTVTSRFGSPLKASSVNLSAISSGSSSHLVASIDKRKAYDIIALSVWLQSIYLVEEYDRLIDNMIPSPSRFLRLGLTLNVENTGLDRAEQHRFWRMTQIRALASNIVVSGCHAGKNMFRTEIFKDSLNQAEQNKFELLKRLREDVWRTMSPILMISADRRPPQLLSTASQGSKLALYLTENIVKMLFDEQEKEFDRLELRKQRSSFGELFRLWQLASLSENKVILEEKMKVLENTNDVDETEIEKFFIPTRTKFESGEGKERKVKAATHVFRFFAWTIGTRNLFNSVKCLLECIRITSSRKALQTMPKLDQLTFLEASTTAILSLVSLHSSTKQEKTANVMVLPNRFLKSYLMSHNTETDLHVLAFNQSIIQTETDNRRSGKFFHQVVALLESICSTLLDSGTLSIRPIDPEDPEKVLTFFRSVILGTSIILNAYLLHDNGDPTIDPKLLESNNTSLLPKYPLGGRVSLLLKRLSRAVASNQAVLGGTGMKNVLDSSDSDVQWVLDELDLLLKDGAGDSLSFFRIIRTDDCQSFIVTECDKLDMAKNMNGLLVEEINDVKKQKELHCHGFLEAANGSTDNPGGTTNRASSDMTSDEISAIARRDDEKRARAVLQRFANQILNTGLFSVLNLRQRNEHTRRMKRFIAICAQKMILDKKWKEPVTWIASLGMELKSTSSIPNPYDFPAMIVTHRRVTRMILKEKAEMWRKYSHDDSQEWTKKGKFHKLLMEYGCLESDCEMSRFRLEQCLCVCENNISLGGSNTGWWIRQRQEVTVEIETLNGIIAKIMLIFEGKKKNGSSIFERPSSTEVNASRADVEKFLSDKVIEEKQQDQEQHVVDDSSIDKDPYDGDDDDDYDDMDYFDSKFSSSSRNRKKG